MDICLLYLGFHNERLLHFNFHYGRGNFHFLWSCVRFLYSINILCNYMVKVIKILDCVQLVRCL